MSGPPPCTTIGFNPTYLSSTTSRANSSRSSGSSIAAPPYLMTTVLPWNSLMYGSASSSVPTSRILAPSCVVVSVDGDVLVRQIGEEHLGLDVNRVPPTQCDLVLDLLRLQGTRQRVRVIGNRGAGRAHLDALEREIHGKRRRKAGPAAERSAERLHDPPPVGIAAVQRCLHQRRVGDGTCGCLRAVAIAAAHEHSRHPRGALAVGHHHDRELTQQRVERLAKAQLVLALGGDVHTARTRAHQDRGVVRRELSVD